MNYASDNSGVLPGNFCRYIDGFSCSGIGSFQLDSYKFSIVSGDSEDFILDDNGTIFTKKISITLDGWVHRFDTYW